MGVRNKQGVLLETYDDKKNSFIVDLQNKLTRKKVVFRVSLLDHVLCGDVKCNGLFDDENKELSISTAKPINQWFPILVHESCHFDQWVENCKPWAKYGEECNDDILEEILAGKTKLSEEEVIRYFTLTRDMELDCERRSLAKIKRWGFDIDPIKYAKQAGAYVAFYNHIAETKEWYKIGKEPYNTPAIIRLMPGNLDGDYSKVNPRVKELFKECCR